MGCIRNGKPRDIMVIKIYVPINGCKEEDSLNFYQKIEEQITRPGRRRERLVIEIGDCNSSIGEGKEDEIIGQYGLGERHRKGQLLVDYFKKKNFCIKSTFGVQAKKRRHTWVRPDGKLKKQIDYILINRIV